MPDITERYLTYPGYTTIKGKSRKGTVDLEPEREVNVFRPNKQGLRKMLGDLEAEIMEIVWQQTPGEQVTVREILDLLNVQRKPPYAYTTIMTVMGNLARKGLLKAHTDQHAHRYEPVMTRETFTRQTVGKIIDELLSDFGEPAIAHFAQATGLSSADGLAKARQQLARHKQQASNPEQQA